jgi:lipid-binding SYLF domain-containing protein
MSKFSVSAVASLLAITLTVAPLHAGEREVRTVEAAAESVRALAAIKLAGIPHTLMRDAHGVAVIPRVLKAGFVIDGRLGHGVLLTRQPDGHWSNPTFLTLGGVGIGWQAGFESTDLVLVFKTARGLDRLLHGKGKLTLGADVSVAAGPIGREAEAATDALLRAEIFTYSRSRGLFAGVALEGAGLRADPRANEAFYGLHGGAAPVLARREVAAVEALKGWLTALSAPPAAPVLVVPPQPPLGLPKAPPPPPPIFPTTPQGR